MKNIFENAKFGDKFRTRDGRMVLFNSPTSFYKGWYWMVVQDNGTCRYFEDGLLNIGEENPLDIIGKWEEEINEEELDRLAMGYELTAPQSGYFNYGVYYNSNDMIECFKAGYRKAKESDYETSN